MKAKNDKKYDLEERTFVFAKNVIEYVRNLPKGIAYSEIGKQLVRSAGSVGANYIEANESLSKKDFIMRVKISKKEAKESKYWLNLSKPNKDHERDKITTYVASETLNFVKTTEVTNEK
jgi:four helix bundle protein